VLRWPHRSFAAEQGESFMRRLAASGLLLAAILAVPSVHLYAQKDKKKKMDAPEVKTIDSAKLHGEFTGKLKSTPGSDRLFIVTLETKKLTPTGKGNLKGSRGNNAVNRIIQLQNKIANDQAALQRARSPQQLRQYYQNLLRDQQQLQQAIYQLLNTTQGGGVPPGYKVDTVKQDVEFQSAEAVKVRTMVLPEQFDDKGNLKKYSKEELAELKGKDKNAVGYESSLEKLEPGMKVKVVLGPAPAPKKEEKKKDDKEDKDKDKDELNPEKKMQAKQIVILEDAASTPAPKGKGKK